MILTATGFLIHHIISQNPPEQGHNPSTMKSSVDVIWIFPDSENGLGDHCVNSACRHLYKALEQSRKKIDFAVYGWRSQSDLFSLLERKKSENIPIRGIVDMDVEGKNYYSHTEKLIHMLGTVKNDLSVDQEKYGRHLGEGFSARQKSEYNISGEEVEIIQKSKEKIQAKGDIMHNKYFILDESTVITGSANVSDSGYGGYNANLVILLQSVKAAEAYTKDFNRMYDQNQFHHKKSEKTSGEKIQINPDEWIRVFFSPVDDPMETVVIPSVMNAKKNIDIAIFYLTHVSLTQALLHAKERGVQIRVIIDASGAANEFSKHPILRKAGIPVKVENWGGKMHAKAMMIDGHTVIGGSMNFTKAGTSRNDENVVLIHSTRIAPKYQAGFEKLWQQIPEEFLTQDPSAESILSIHSCADGSDNDYDGYTDKEDYGCDPKKDVKYRYAR